MSKKAELLKFIKKLPQSFFDKIKEYMRLFTILKARGIVSIYECLDDGSEMLLHHDPNVVVKLGKQILARRLATNDPLDMIAEIRLGTGGHEPGDPSTPNPNQPTEDDVGLEAEEFTKALAGTPIAVAGGLGVQFSFILEKTEANGTGSVQYTEAGLYNGNNTMFARETFAFFRKDSTIKIKVLWTIVF